MDYTVTLKMWMDKDAFHVQSPTGRVLRIAEREIWADKAQPADEAVFERVYALYTAQAAERAAWEAAKYKQMRKIADKRGKTWIYDLGQLYLNHIALLRKRYPIGSGVVAVVIPRDDMAALLRISKL